MSWPAWQPAPLHPVCAPGEVHLWLAALDRADAEWLELSACLLAAERERAARLRRESDRRRWMIARGILRRILARYGGLPPEQVELAAAPQGKPYWVNASRLQFSVAHSEAWALYAVAAGFPVGVDLERLRPVPEMEAFRTRWFTPEAAAALRALSGEAQLEFFFEHWTREEARVKACGGGLGSWLAAPGDPCHAAHWEVTSFTPAPGYHAALAVPPAAAPTVLFWNFPPTP